MDLGTGPGGGQFDAGNQLQLNLCRMLQQKMVGGDSVVISDGQSVDVALLRSQAKLKRVKRTIRSGGVAV